MLQWNMDESYFGKPGFVGIGGVLRYHKVMVLGLFTIPAGIKNLLVMVKALELSFQRRICLK
jgi:hypothetical protein